MFLKSSLVLSVSLLSLLLSPASSITTFAQQPAKPTPQGQFEPAITRVRNALSLDDAQTEELRKIFAKHEAKLIQLRNRAQGQPYSPQIQAELGAEQTAVRDELTPFLNDEQKMKIATTDLRPIPAPPGFILVDIPRRTMSGPVADRLIPAVSVAPKGKPGQLTDDQKILHLLDRATFGPRPGDLDSVKRMGMPAFLEEQLHPERMDDSDLEKRLAVLPTLQMSSLELLQLYPQPNVADQRAKDKNAPPVYGRPYQVIAELMQQKLVRAADSNRQLQEVMTDFWFNHFNVFWQKDADLYMLTSYERDVIRPNALGKFRDLLLAVAQSPAMMYYLDNWLSVAPGSKRPNAPALPKPPAAQPPKPKPTAAPAAALVARTANHQIAAPTNQAGQKAPEAAKPADQAKPAPAKPAAPPANKPGINENYARELMELHTMGVDGGYTQKDVQEVARCFTGWTIDRPYVNAAFIFKPWTHDEGSKTVLGVTIPGGGGISDGQRVIDILSRHPSTAHFISQKLCQRFVADTPPPKLVDRVAQVFLKTDGDIREVLRAILTSPEFNSTTTFRSKIKSPLELAASAIRAVDGTTNGAPALQSWLQRTGEPLYQYMFPTGYGEDSSRWVNTGVFLNRLNFVVAIANNQVPGTVYDPARFLPSEAVSPDALAERLEASIVHTRLSPESWNAVRVGLAENAPQPAGAHAPAASAEAHAAAMGAAVPVSARSEPQSANRAVPGKLDESAARRKVTQVVQLLFGTAEFQRK